jgi:hypothetical protein
MACPRKDTTPPQYIVTIEYQDGRREASQRLRRNEAHWFYTTMRASHGDLVTITLEKVA